MIKIEGVKADMEANYFQRQKEERRAVHSLAVPEKLQDQFNLICDGPQIFDPMKLVEAYLYQRKFEAMRQVMKDKQVELDKKYYPVTNSRESVRDRIALRNPKLFPKMQRKKARALMTEIKRVKTVFCHRALTEELNSKINSSPDI